MKVMLRPLEEKDSKKSCHWRNDAQIWQFTGSRPSTHITADIERDWIHNALTKPDEIRFAICVGDKQDYVGNVQLTRITENDAEFHIFIGETNSHGKGVGSQATQLLLEHARHVLGLREIYLNVHVDNIAAIRIYEKCGFELSDTDQKNLTYLRRLSS